jgi:hypothetical protein
VKVGDLVKWSEASECWHLAHSLQVSLVDSRKRGIIVNQNPKYFFVFWENGETVCNEPRDLELISEAR